MVTDFPLWALVALGGALAAYHVHFRVSLHNKRATATRNSVRDSANQLRFVMRAEFHKKKTMNKSEYQVFRTIEQEVRSINQGYRVFAQTSLGEIIGSDDGRAFNSINSKRVDILIIDPWGYPAAVFEYQGRGHYQGDAAARDAVKKEALRKAGVAYVEVSTTDDAKTIKLNLHKALEQNAPRRPIDRAGPVPFAAS
jgi:hypothetical protein